MLLRDSFKCYNITVLVWVGFFIKSFLHIFLSKIILLEIHIRQILNMHKELFHCSSFTIALYLLKCMDTFVQSTFITVKPFTIYRFTSELKVLSP